MKSQKSAACAQHVRSILLIIVGHSHPCPPRISPSFFAHRGATIAWWALKKLFCHLLLSSVTYIWCAMSKPGQYLEIMRNTRIRCDCRLIVNIVEVFEFLSWKFSSNVSRESNCKMFLSCSTRLTSLFASFRGSFCWAQKACDVWTLVDARCADGIICAWSATVLSICFFKILHLLTVDEERWKAVPPGPVRRYFRILLFSLPFWVFLHSYSHSSCGGYFLLICFCSPQLNFVSEHRWQWHLQIHRKIVPRQNVAAAQ